MSTRFCFSPIFGCFPLHWPATQAGSPALWPGSLVSQKPVLRKEKCSLQEIKPGIEFHLPSRNHCDLREWGWWWRERIHWVKARTGGYGVNSPAWIKEGRDCLPHMKSAESCQEDKSKGHVAPRGEWKGKEKSVYRVKHTLWRKTRMKYETRKECKCNSLYLPESMYDWAFAGVFFFLFD